MIGAGGAGNVDEMLLTTALKKITPPIHPMANEPASHRNTSALFSNISRRTP